MISINEETTFDNVCRICCGESETGELMSVFSNDDLLERVTSCLPITIHKEDTLPHRICQNCFKDVQQTHALIEKALASENYFIECLKNLEDFKSQIDVQPNDPDFNKDDTLKLDLDGSFQCDLCKVEMSDPLQLDLHIQEQHVNQKLPPNTEFVVNKICSLCGQLFDCEQNYLMHKCESQNKCTICSKIMPSKCLLNRHIQHSCKSLFYCPHCHKAFAAKLPLLKHVEIHTGEKSKTQCLACDRKSLGRGEVVQHTCGLTVEETGSPMRYKCYICGSSYKRQLNLARHCLQHEPESNTQWKFKCLKCNDVFEKEKKLHTHYEKVHKMARAWICRFCGKSLSTKLSVQIHERIHTQVKPYVCEWCGNRFRCKPNLIQHQAMHTGIRRHKCPICGKMFARPFFLKTHLRVHTGERPYQCEICERRFTQLTDMKRHRKRHDKQSADNVIVDTVSMDQPAVIIISGTDGQPITELQEVAFDNTFSPFDLKIEASDEHQVHPVQVMESY